MVKTSWILFGCIGVGVACGLGACGGGGNDASSGTDAGNGETGGGDDSGFDLEVGPGANVDSIAISPAMATITALNGATPSQAFTLKGHLADGSWIDLGGAPAWASTHPSVGTLSGNTFTASGAVGGLVDVTATYKGMSATAKLTVKLAFSKDATGALDDPTMAALRAATTPDAVMKWAYPYDDTVWPRGLQGPTLQWNGAATGVIYYRFDLQSDLFDYEVFDRGMNNRFDFPADIWNKFVETTSGKATLTVTKLSGASATVVTKLNWTVAPGSMRGTIYYWSNREGRVLRIKPGATSPDDFSASALPASVDYAGTHFTCTMTCHSVSADGSTMVSGGDVFGGSYDLKTNKPRYNIGGNPGSTARLWNTPALTPDGKYMFKNGESFAGTPNGGDGLFKTADGTHLAGSGLDGVKGWHPAFTPDGSFLVYADYAAGVPVSKLMSVAFDPTTVKATGAPVKITDAAAVAGLPVIAYPSGTPDGKWVVYQRSSGGAAIAGVTGGSDTYDTRGHCVGGEPLCRYDNRGDLYLASTSGGGEVALTKANGTGYPFAAGDRDRQYNFEPTMAPISAGGYFWVVFTTRRTYGNLQTAGLPEMKQLWVAAIEQNPAPGKDPSHAAFRLPGQELQYTNPDGSKTNALNMRGFWALDPCHSDGTTCGTGSECCGGYCQVASGATSGMCTSTKPTCSADGDKCDTSADCCGKDTGTTCIGHVCSVAPPS
jgi:hypothetical protein